MPTNEDTPVPGPASNGKALEVSRPAVVEQQVDGWAPVAPTIATQAQGYTDMRMYMHALRRHWLLTVSLTGITALVVGVATLLLMPKQYTASALLQVAMQEKRLVFDTAEQTLRSDYDVYKNTQKQLVRSRFVLTAALRRPDASRVRTIQQEVDPVAWLASELMVRFPGDSEIMDISLTEDDPNEVATLVGAVTEAYFDEVVDRDRNERQEQLSALERVYTDHETELRSRRNALKRLADSLGTGDTEALTFKQKILLEQFSQFRSELTRVQFELMEAEGELKAEQANLDNAEEMEVSEFELDLAAEEDLVGKQLLMVLAGVRQQMAFNNSSATTQAATRSSSRAERLLAGVQAQFERRREELREKLRMKKHVELQKKIDDLQNKVGILTEQKRQIEVDVEQKKNEAEKVGESSVELEMMRAEIEQSSRVLSDIAQQKEELKVELRSNPRIQLVQRAEVPKSADDQTVRIALTIFTMLLGATVPAVGVALWDLRGQRINSAMEVSKGLGLTVIGSVPVIPDRAIRKLASPSKQRDHWHGRLTESVDSIAARLLRKAALEQARTILVTSAVSGEGKTTLATQLAMSLARAGRRTILVDFDLRRPVVERIFGLPLEPGVSDVLRGDVRAEEIVQETAIDNLFVATSGRLDQTALVSLSNGGDGPLVAKLREQFEFVVVDGSPLLPVADTRFISQHVDSVILSVLRDFSQTPKILAACETLEAFGIRDVGVVVAGANEDPYSYDPYYRRRILAG